MDFLLETIGFPPDWCGSALLPSFGAAQRGGRPAPLRLAGGLEVHPDRELTPRCDQDLPLGERGSDRDPARGAAGVQSTSALGTAPDLFWPGYSGGRLQRLRAERCEAVAASPFARVVTGRIQSEDDPFGERPGTPIQALLHGRGDGGEPALAPQAPETFARPRLLEMRLSAFALEVSSILPAVQQHRMTPERAPQGRSARITPLCGPDDPAGCCELDLAVSAVHVLNNPLTGCAVDLIEAVPPWSSLDSQSVASPLALFVSPWQLAEDRLERPAPGDRVRGTFLLVAREERT